MRATQAPPGYTNLRRDLADASERLRTFSLGSDTAELCREIACTALAALQTVLLADADPSTGGLVAPLVRDDIARVTELLAAATR
jgi:hypothetical protein